MLNISRWRSTAWMTGAALAGVVSQIGVYEWRNCQVKALSRQITIA